MNNYQHHDKAQELADSHSAYELARRVVELDDKANTLDAICDLLCIGDKARNHSVIMTCIGNINRFSEMLHAVEQKFFMVTSETDEDYTSEERGEECLVNSWGSTKEQYLEQFERALKLVELESARGEAVAYLTWHQGMVAIDDYAEYLEVANPDDKSCDGTPAFPVYAAPPAPASVPEGWQLVPVEPTQEMVVAGGGAIDMNGGEGGDDEMQSDAIHAYSAMLAAAPTPSTQTARSE